MKPHSKASPPGSARLFAEAHSPAPPAGVHLAYVDGASRGNPGPASYAAIVRGPDGKIIFELGKTLGVATNNAAEYHGLITALDYAAHNGIKRLRVRSDSELLVHQMNGRYRVRSADLKPLHERAAKLANQFEYFAIEHVRREENSDADALANQALDQRGNAGRSAAVQAASAGSPSRVETRSPVTDAENSKGNDSPSIGSVRGSSSAPSPERHRFRARFTGGVFVPAESLDFPEDTEFEVEIRKAKP
jgi:ribonuclease HI